MSRLRNLPSQFSISLPVGDDGLLGRECPESACAGYFKLKPGTGLPGSSCVCPYCGHAGEASDFHTKDQVEYAKSVVINKVTGAFLEDLKSMARSTHGGFITMKVSGSAHPIRRYSEQDLETHVNCDKCSLEYAIYGLFAFCPDCRQHNSEQMLEKNLLLAERMLALTDGGVIDVDLRAHVIGDALENVVSAFDGFGRETVRVHSARATAPNRAAAISFQNLVGAQGNIRALFGIDLSAPLSSDEWNAVCRCFQKRHLLAHKMGVVDEAYLLATSDPNSVRGRKVAVETSEVRELIASIRRVAATLETALRTPSP